MGHPGRSLSVSLSASRLPSVDRAIVVMRNVRGSAAGHGRSPAVTRLRSRLCHEVANSWLSAVARDCVLLDRSSRRGHPHPQGWFTGVPQVSSPASSESTAPLTWGVGAPRYSCAAPIPRVALLGVQLHELAGPRERLVGRTSLRPFRLNVHAGMLRETVARSTKRPSGRPISRKRRRPCEGANQSGIELGRDVQVARHSRSSLETKLDLRQRYRRSRVSARDLIEGFPDNVRPSRGVVYGEPIKTGGSRTHPDRGGTVSSGWGCGEGSEPLPMAYRH